MVWEWRLRRCFEDFAETFEQKGWEVGPRPGGMPALVAWSGDHCILYDSWDDMTDECWFELRDREGWSSVRVNEIPTPQQAARLLSERNLLAQ